MDNKRYLLTIPVVLNDLCKGLVEGDGHFRGSRNAFYVEAIETAVIDRLGESALSYRERKAVAESGARNDFKRKTSQVSPNHPRGKTPVLEYRDMAIRNDCNIPYRVKAGPGQLDQETDEQYFNRIKTIPGVMFETVRPEYCSPLNSPLVTMVPGAGSG